MHGGKGTHGSLVFKKLDLKVKAGLTLVSFIPYWAGLSTLSPLPPTPLQLILGVLSGVCGAMRGSVHG